MKAAEGSAGPAARSATAFPRCSIIIITYNGKEMLRKYLPTITSQDYPNFEVVVVDNASTDGTADFISENYPQLKLVRSETNTGTAEGSNIGARASTGDLFFWIHNDMILERDALRLMVETITSSDDIGVCTCKVIKLNPDGSPTNTIDSVGGTIDRWGFPSARGIGEEDRGQYDSVFDTFFSFGGPMLMKREAFDAAGGFDPVVFTLADDIDLCWRARLRGYRTVVNTKAVIYHHLSATLSSFARSNKRYISERNTLYMLLKNYSAASLLRFLPLYFLMISAEITTLALLRKRQIALASVRGILWNLKRLGTIAAERRAIQKSRVTAEGEIIRLMLPQPQKLMIFRDFLKNRKSKKWAGYFGN